MKKHDEKEIESILNDMQCEGTPSPYFVAAISVLFVVGIGCIFFLAVSS